MLPPALVEKMRRYAKRFRLRVFTRFENTPGSLFRRELKQHCCAPGSEDSTLLIAPEKRDVVITKRGDDLIQGDCPNTFSPPQRGGFFRHLTFTVSIGTDF